MGFVKVPQHYKILSVALLVLLLAVSDSQNASIQDVLNLNTPTLSRIPRESQYYRYGSSSSVGSQTVSSRPIKPEDAPEARERDGTNVEKRCIRCDYYNNRDYRYPSDYRSRYDDRYDDRYNRERYDDRYNRDRYDDYDRKYYDTDRRYYDYDRRYDDRDRYYDRYERDRYDRRPEYYYDRYDRYDRYDGRDRYDKNDRNRYDKYDRGGYRPWDETTRGSSGFDSAGRGYYFAVGRPEYSNYGSGYASNWNYSKDDYNRDRGWREQGFSSGSYRPRDPYDPGYRGTSYLYGRPSSTTTTQSPSSSGGSTVTANPQTQANTSSG